MNEMENSKTTTISKIECIYSSSPGIWESFPLTTKHRDIMYSMGNRVSNMVITFYGDRR